MAEWQPIASAPRDGTVILLAKQRSIPTSWEVYAGFYDPNDGAFNWQFFDGQNELNGWRDDERWGPSHWTAMPSPPQQSVPEKP